MSGAYPNNSCLPSNYLLLTSFIVCLKSFIACLNPNIGKIINIIEITNRAIRSNNKTS